MLSFLIGKALSSDSMALLPLLSAGTHIAANALTSNNDNMADIMAQKAMARDLYIEPLIRAKKASADLTLKQLYSIPLGVI
jgi:acetyl-CoA acetyltransferase